MGNTVQSTVEARVGVATQGFVDDVAKACSRINKILNDIQNFTAIPETANAAVALCSSYLKEINNFENDADQKLRVLQDQITRAAEDLVTEKNDAIEKAIKLDADQKALDIEWKSVQQVLTQISTLQETIKKSDDAVSKYDAAIKKYDERVKKNNEVIKFTRESANVQQQQVDELKTRMQETDRKQESTLKGYTTTIDRMNVLEEAMGRYNEGDQNAEAGIRRLQEFVTHHERLTNPPAGLRDEFIEHLREELAKAQQDAKELPAARASLKDAKEKISAQQNEILKYQTQVHHLQENYDHLERELGECRIHNAVGDRNL